MLTSQAYRCVRSCASTLYPAVDATVYLEIFEGENFRENDDQEDFAEKTFAGSYYRPKKTFANGPRFALFAKVFSLESFPLYGICSIYYGIYHQNAI